MIELYQEYKTNGGMRDWWQWHALVKKGTVILSD